MSVILFFFPRVPSRYPYTQPSSSQATSFKLDKYDLLLSMLKLPFTNYVILDVGKRNFRRILIQTLQFLTHLSTRTRQDGFENRDKVYSFSIFSIFFFAKGTLAPFEVEQCNIR